MSNDVKVIELPQSLTVRDLAEAMEASPIEVIKTLMANGVMANINQLIDFDTAEIVAAELGIEAVPELIDIDDVESEDELPLWRRLIAGESEKNLVDRPPVITILGHVDHGKTTLLDAVRDTSVVTGEAGGITQHIAAYQVLHDDKPITFLDTPGHAAFTAMRARGAQGADIVVLVVAADDGVMPQTREALAHAKAAQVPIVVALNKVDRPNANIERVKRQLADLELVPDDWDGDTLMIPVSATEKTGIADLLEAILLVADEEDIRANPEGRLIGSVIEARREKSRGVVATLLVQNGKLKVGDILLAGLSHGRVKAMFDFQGNRITEADPSSPISVMGLNEVPDAGELFTVVDSDKDARHRVAQRVEQRKASELVSQGQVTLEKLFEQVQAGQVAELRLVVKADVQGSLEPIVSSVSELDVEGLKAKILHSGTGNIGENDVMLAAASNAVVIGFNVVPVGAARKLSDSKGISIRTYNIIYRLLEDVEKSLKGMLAPEEVTTVIGKAEVRATFKIPRQGRVAGCYVLDGEIRRNAQARVVRAGETVYEGDMASLRHHAEDVREIRQGFECGIGVRGFDRYKVGDIIENFTIELVPVS